MLLKMMIFYMKFFHSYDINEHLRAYILPFAEKISTLNNLYPNTKHSENQRNYIESIIINSLEKKTPFSMIRLGDGEGAFLPYKDNSFQEEDQNFASNIWFNRNLTNQESKKLTELLKLSIDKSDILGIPDIKRIVDDFKPQETSYRKRTMQSIYSLEQLITIKNLTSAFIHIDMLHSNMLGRIIKKSNKNEISIISGHEEHLIRDKMEILYNTIIARYYKIPTEAKRINQFNNTNEFDELNHYPDVFNNTMQRIEQECEIGDLYLIGAGLLGKIYCSKVKEKGGIALDIGSVFDYLLSYQTRRHLSLSPMQIKYLAN